MRKDAVLCVYVRCVVLVRYRFSCTATSLMYRSQVRYFDLSWIFWTPDSGAVVPVCAVNGSGCGSLSATELFLLWQPGVFVIFNLASILDLALVRHAEKLLDPKKRKIELQLQQMGSKDLKRMRESRSAAGGLRAGASAEAEGASAEAEVNGGAREGGGGGEAAASGAKVSEPVCNDFVMNNPMRSPSKAMRLRSHGSSAAFPASECKDGDDVGDAAGAGVRTGVSDSVGDRGVGAADDGSADTGGTGTGGGPPPVSGNKTVPTHKRIGTHEVIEVDNINELFAGGISDRGSGTKEGDTSSSGGKNSGKDSKAGGRLSKRHSSGTSRARSAVTAGLSETQKVFCGNCRFARGKDARCAVLAIPLGIVGLILMVGGLAVIFSQSSACSAAFPELWPNAYPRVIFNMSSDGGAQTGFAAVCGTDKVLSIDLRRSSRVELPQSLGNFSALKTLILSRKVERLPPSLFAFHSKLQLSFADPATVTGGAAGTTGAAVTTDACSSALAKYVNLSNYGLTAFPDMLVLETHAWLRRFDLSHNRLTRVPVTQLQQLERAKLPGLLLKSDCGPVRIILAWNEIKAVPLEVMQPWEEGLLDLSHNPITWINWTSDEGHLDHIPPQIRQLAQTERITLDRQLDLRALPTELASLPALRDVSLRHTALDNASVLFTITARIPNLRSLDIASSGTVGALFRNGTTVGAQLAADRDATLSRLTRLGLADNALGELHLSWTSTLGSVTDLDLAWNRLQGLPSNLGALAPALVALNLRGNNFLNAPASLASFDMKHLKMLDVTCNEAPPICACRNSSGTGDASVTGATKTTPLSLGMRCRASLEDACALNRRGGSSVVDGNGGAGAEGAGPTTTSNNRNASRSPLVRVLCQACAASLASPWPSWEGGASAVPPSSGTAAASDAAQCLAAFNTLADEQWRCSAWAKDGPDGVRKRVKQQIEQRTTMCCTDSLQCVRRAVGGSGGSGGSGGNGGSGPCPAT